MGLKQPQDQEPHTSGGKSWDWRILISSEHQQCRPCSALSPFPTRSCCQATGTPHLSPSRHPFSTLQPEWAFKQQVRSPPAPVLKPSSAFMVLLEYKLNSISCCREDPACCPMLFLCHVPSSPPPAQSHFLPMSSNQPGLFPLPGMLFPQTSAFWFLFIFHFL